MKASHLIAGDRIRITKVPDGVFLSETVDVYERIIARNRPVRIYEVDKWGTPWYEVRIRVDGRLEYHHLAVMEEDKNWVWVG